MQRGENLKLFLDVTFGSDIFVVKKYILVFIFQFTGSA